MPVTAVPTYKTEGVIIMKQNTFPHRFIVSFMILCMVFSALCIGSGVAEYSCSECYHRSTAQKIFKAYDGNGGCATLTLNSSTSVRYRFTYRGIRLIDATIRVPGLKTDMEGKLELISENFDFMAESLECILQFMTKHPNGERKDVVKESSIYNYRQPKDRTEI